MLDLKRIYYFSNLLYESFVKKNDQYSQTLQRHFFANDNVVHKILHELQKPTLIHYLLSCKDKQDLALSCGALLFGRSLARVVVKSDVQKIRDILGSQRRDWAIKNANALGLAPYPLTDDIKDDYFCNHGYALMIHICHNTQTIMLQDMLRHALSHDSDVVLQKSQQLAAAHIVEEALKYKESLLTG